MTNFITDRIARGITRPSCFEIAMPDWDGTESTVAYVIRKRNERRIAQAMRVRRIWTCLSLLLLPVALLVGLAAAEIATSAFDPSTLTALIP